MKVAASLLLVATVCLLPGACGCSPAASNPDRLTVTNDLRIACAVSEPTDEEILASITGAEEARLMGYTYEQLIDNVTQGCITQGIDVAECTSCGIAIVDQVYGR